MPGRSCGRGTLHSASPDGPPAPRNRALAVADDRINSFLVGADEQAVATLKGHLVDLLCRETRGGCTYTGRDMRTAHAGLGPTDAHFDPLLAILGPMRNDVLGR